MSTALETRPETKKPTDSDDLWHMACKSCRIEAEQQGIPAKTYCGITLKGIAKRRDHEETRDLCVVCNEISKSEGCQIHWK